MNPFEEVPKHEMPRVASGCGPRIAGLIIVFFVNVPLVNVGWRRLWHTAPVLLIVALVVDVFLVLLIALWLWRRQQTRPPDPPVPD